MPEKELHEVVIGSDLSIKKKNLPTDPFYKAVDIKESRRKSSVVPSLDMSMEYIVKQCTVQCTVHSTHCTVQC